MKNRQGHQFKLDKNYRTVSSKLSFTIILIALSCGAKILDVEAKQSIRDMRLEESVIHV